MYPILVERPVCTCEVCGADLFTDDPWWDIDGMMHCEGCKDEWLGERKHWAE